MGDNVHIVRRRTPMIGGTLLTLSQVLEPSASRSPYGASPKYCIIMYLSQYLDNTSHYLPAHGIGIASPRLIIKYNMPFSFGAYLRLGWVNSKIKLSLIVKLL
jgi:hypothetical protein